MDACAALVSQVPTLVAADHDASDDEAHPREAERRGVLEAHLDHDGIGAPEDRDEHGHGRALEVHVFRRMAQNALEDTTPGIITS